MSDWRRTCASGKVAAGHLKLYFKDAGKSRIDHIRDLSTAKDTVILLSLVLLWIDSFLELRVLDDLLQGGGDSRETRLTVWE